MGLHYCINGQKATLYETEPQGPHLFRKHFDDTQSPSTQMITFTEGPVDLGLKGGTFAPLPKYLADSINLSKLGGRFSPSFTI